jgi:putative membrane protein
MLKIIMAAGALALSGSGALAQAVSPTNTGSMSSMDTGTTPIAGQNEPAFVMAASDANLYQIKAAQFAVTKAQRDDVKAFAKRVQTEAQIAQKALMAALRNDQRTIKAPSSSLSSDRAALVKLLQKTPRGSFDNLYLSQSAQVLQAAWAINKGYAQDGTDPALKQVAGTAVPTLEQELTNGKALLPSALTGGQ